MPARAASFTRHRVVGFWRCITDRPTDAVIRDATFLFDSSPCTWYLKRRDYCRHLWKRKGVFTYAKTHPQMVPHRSTFTDSDVRVCRARQKRDADIMPPKSRNLSTEIGLPTVSTVHLSRRGREIDTPVDKQRKGVKTCFYENTIYPYRCFYC